jgi:hypothetical protein
MKRTISVLMLTAALVAAPLAAHAASSVGASMNGASEVPGPGDPDGTGIVQLAISAKKGRVCFLIEVANIGTPATAAHVHLGEAGVAGPVVIPLPAPGPFGVSAACLYDLDHSLLRDIRDNPSEYYVNVHNAAYPGGAIRGQLSA